MDRQIFAIIGMIAIGVSAYLVTDLVKNYLKPGAFKLPSRRPSKPSTPDIPRVQREPKLEMPTAAVPTAEQVEHSQAISPIPEAPNRNTTDPEAVSSPPAALPALSPAQPAEIAPQPENASHQPVHELPISPVEST